MPRKSSRAARSAEPSEKVGTTGGVPRPAAPPVSPPDEDGFGDDKKIRTGKPLSAAGRERLARRLAKMEESGYAIGAKLVMDPRWKLVTEETDAIRESWGDLIEMGEEFPGVMLGVALLSHVATHLAPVAVRAMLPPLSPEERALYMRQLQEEAREKRKADSDAALAALRGGGGKAGE